MLITALIISFCKDGRVGVSVNLWFVVVSVRCEVLSGVCSNDLYCSPNIVRVIKSRKMRWSGHVARMYEERGGV